MFPATREWVSHTATLSAVTLSLIVRTTDSHNRLPDYKCTATNLEQLDSFIANVKRKGIIDTFFLKLC